MVFCDKLVWCDIRGSGVIYVGQIPSLVRHTWGWCDIRGSEP